MKEILQYLKMHGERFDTDIAVATGIPLTNVYLHLSHLIARGEVMAYRSIRLEKNKKIDWISCQIAGYVPPET